MNVNILIFISLILVATVILVPILLALRVKGDAPVRIPKHGENFPILEVGTLKTGDIIGIAYRGIRSLISKVLSGTVWTHVGVIYVEPSTGEVQVIEAANYRPPYQGNVIKVPILYWIRVNMNVDMIAIMRANKAISAEKISNSYDRICALNIGVEDLDISWRRFYMKKTPFEVPPHSLFANEERRLSAADASTARKATTEHKIKKFTRKCLKKVGAMDTEKMPYDNYDYVLTCNELTVMLLQDAGVFGNTYTACSYLPLEIMSRDVEMANGYKYSVPVAVSVNELAGDEYRGL